MNAKTISVGYTFEFVYEGGEHYGQKRVAYCYSKDHNINCYDFTFQGLRKFNPSKMICVKVNHSTVKLHTDFLPKNTDYEQIVKDYAKDGLVAFHDATNNRLVVYRPIKLEPTLSCKDNVWTLSNGDKFVSVQLDIISNTLRYRDESHSNTGYFRNSYYDLSAQKLAEQIKRVMA